MFLDRKYVIASAIAAFIAWALLTDFAPSLRWIPHAFLVGILVTIFGYLYLIFTTSKSLSYASKPSQQYASVKPAFCAWEKWEEEKAALKEQEEYRRPTIFPEVFIFSRAVDGLLDLILQDYVTSWFGNITRRPLLQNEIDRNIRSALLSITARLMQQDLVELGVSKLLPLVTQHLKDFSQAEQVVLGKDLVNNVTESDELGMAIASKYRNGKLHPVATLATSDMNSSSQEHMRILVSKILPLVLPANMLSSPTVSVIIREIVACALLSPVAQMLADPDTINQIIINTGGAALRDRKSVRKVRAALDQHAPVPSKGANTSPFPRLRPYDSERQFERFVRLITHTSNLTDARRFRNEIVSQLRRDSQIQGQDAAYLRRVETGKRLLDQRILVLSANTASGPSTVTPKSSERDELTFRKRNASLREVIYDAAGLGYFMEFLDRQNLMTLVQFYLVVDGFRNPLEGDTEEPPSSLATDPDRMDVAQMYQQYLTNPELQTPESVLEVVRKYLNAGSSASIEDYLDARHAVLRTQTRVYNFLTDKYFVPFKRSDLYYKWLATSDNLVIPGLQEKHADQIKPDSNRTTEPSATSAPKLPPRTSSRVSPFRQPALSASDLKSLAGPTNLLAEPPRRSLDDGSPRPALFDDDVEDERMSHSFPSLYNSDSEHEAIQKYKDETTAIDAMQLALDSIASSDQHKDSIFDETSELRSSNAVKSGNALQRLSRPTLTAQSSSDSEKPSISSLGLIGAPLRREGLTDDLSRDGKEKATEVDHDDSDGQDRSDDGKIQEAAPGDLGLTEAIDTLNAEIERLNAQRRVLGSLTAKAELTNNTAELRILDKSEQSLQREIKRKEMQKEQYMAQENDNDLYGQASVSIKSVMVGRESDGREYALYVIEVRRQAGNRMAAATWAITRRYSQFHDLHKRLKARFPRVRELDFPRRQTIFTLQKDFLQRRRLVLERYLRSLLLVPAICRSRELRAFLSQSTISSEGGNDTQIDANDLVTRIYNSVSGDMEEFVGNLPVLDHLSVAGQNLISAATAQSNGPPIDSLDATTRDPTTAAEAEKELHAYEVKDVEPFVKPICDIFLEIFELGKSSNWLRGRTVVVVLHQLLGGTIERRVRETAKTAMEDESLAQSVSKLQAILWPNGKIRSPSEPRTTAEKAHARREAGLLLTALIPELAGSVVGKTNAQAASRKLMAMVNNPRLK